MASPVSHHQMITSNDTGTMITSDPKELMKTPGTKGLQRPAGIRAGLISHPVSMAGTGSFHFRPRLPDILSRCWIYSCLFPPKMVVSRPNTLCMLMLHHILLNNINSSLGTINHLWLIFPATNLHLVRGFPSQPCLITGSSVLPFIIIHHYEPFCIKYDWTTIYHS